MSRHGSPRGRLAAAALLAALLLAAASLALAQKGASVTLKARWPGTPYLAEAAEFLAEESADKYWAFLDALRSAPPVDPSEQDAVCWDAILDAGETLLSPGVAKVLPVSLGVRQYSARLEAYRQIAAQLHPGSDAYGCCFADVGGSVLRDPGQLASALAAAKGAGSADGDSGPKPAQVFDFDHVYNPGARAPGAAYVILYAPPGSECFDAWHAAITGALAGGSGSAAGSGNGSSSGSGTGSSSGSSSGGLVYVHRPWAGPSCQLAGCGGFGTRDPVLLPGYGMEAALKNTEYSAIDDKAKAGALHLHPAMPRLLCLLHCDQLDMGRKSG